MRHHREIVFAGLIVTFHAGMMDVQNISRQHLIKTQNRTRTHELWQVHIADSAILLDVDPSTRAAALSYGLQDL